MGRRVTNSTRAARRRRDEEPRTLSDTHRQRPVPGRGWRCRLPPCSSDAHLHPRRRERLHIERRQPCRRRPALRMAKASRRAVRSTEASAAPRLLLRRLFRRGARLVARISPSTMSTITTITCCCCCKSCCCFPSCSVRWTWSCPCAPVLIEEVGSCLEAGSRDGREHPSARGRGLKPAASKRRVSSRPYSPHRCRTPPKVRAAARPMPIGAPEPNRRRRESRGTGSRLPEVEAQCGRRGAALARFLGAARFDAARRSAQFRRGAHLVQRRECLVGRRPVCNVWRFIGVGGGGVGCGGGGRGCHCCSRRLITIGRKHGGPIHPDTPNIKQQAERSRTATTTGICQSLQQQEQLQPAAAAAAA